MLKFSLLIILTLLTGCAVTPYKVTVYGRSGARFTAPSLCAALVQCLNSAESSCYYDHTTITTGSSTEDFGCKEVKSWNQ
jgi:hypothetical protein